MRKSSLMFYLSILFALIFICGYSATYCSAQSQEVQKPPISVQNQIELLKLEFEKLKSAHEQSQEDQKPQIIQPNNVDHEKIVSKNIELDNIRYKDRIFGNPFCGLAMSIEPLQDEFEIGNKIGISILYKNFSKKELVLQRVNDSKHIEDFRYAMYFPDGNSVQKSYLVEEFEASINKPRTLPRVSSRQIRNLQPRQILSYIVEVSRFFKIEKAGTYSLVIMRRITDSWQDGFMISNMIKIKIVNKKEEK